MENHSAEWVKETMENAERTKMNLERCKYGKEKPNCSECDFKPWIKPICQRLLCSVAFELINSQEQRIKELTEENERLRCEVADLKDELICEKETNAHLSSQYMSENHLRHQAEEMLANGMPVAKADTVRKMQERLKGRNEVYCVNKADLKTMNFVVDQIAKEMLEGENEN